MSTEKNHRESMTVSLDAGLVRSLKKGAVAAGRPLSWFVEDLIRLGQQPAHAPTRTAKARA